MMDNKVYISGEQIDLFDSTKVAITYDFPSVLLGKDFQAAFTKTIKAPKTPTNDRIFGYGSIVPSNSLVPYKKHSAEIHRNGIVILRDGFAYVKSFLGHYSLNIYGGSCGALLGIKGKKLTDLDLSDYDHDRILSEISYDHTSVFSWREFIYAIIEWGDEATLGGVEQVIPARYVNVENLFPCMRVCVVLDKIISEAGYRLMTDVGLDGDASEFGTMFDELIIPPATNKADDATCVQYANMRCTRLTDFLLPLSAGVKDCVVLFDSFSSFRSWQYETKQTTYYTTYNYTQFNILSAGRYKIVCKITLTGTGTGYTIVRLIVAGDDALSAFDILAYEGHSMNGVDDHEFNFEYDGMLGRGEFLAIEINKQTPTGALSVKGGAGYNDINITEVSNAETAEHGFNFPMGINMPDIKQSDLLKDLSARFGLMYYSDPITKEFYIYRLEDIIAKIGSGDSFDWSDKLDLSKPVMIEHRGADYAQRNLFKNKKDDTVLEGTGDWYLDVADENLKEQKELYKSPFAASNIGLWIADCSPAKINQYNYVGERVNDVSPRILYVYPKMGYPFLVVLRSLLEGSTFTINPLTAVKIGSFGLNGTVGSSTSLWFDYLLANNHDGLISVLDKYKKVTANFILSDVDILNLDPRIPSYVSHFSAFFYVNKIKDSRGGSTPVELIKL